jgi:hypothetical protein
MVTTHTAEVKQKTRKKSFLPGSTVFSPKTSQRRRRSLMCGNGLRKSRTQKPWIVPIPGRATSITSSLLFCGDDRNAKKIARG